MPTKTATKGRARKKQSVNEQADEMLAAGLTPAVVSKQLKNKISADALRKRVKRAKARADPSVPPVRRQGRPAKLTAAMKEDLVAWAHEHRQSAKALAERLAAKYEMKTTVSRKTIYRALDVPPMDGQQTRRHAEKTLVESRDS